MSKPIIRITFEDEAELDHLLAETKAETLREFADEIEAELPEDGPDNRRTGNGMWILRRARTLAAEHDPNKETP